MENNHVSAVTANEDGYDSMQSNNEQWRSDSFECKLVVDGKLQHLWLAIMTGELQRL